MHFAYSHGRNWDDGVPNGFNINGDWTKFAGFGAVRLAVPLGRHSAGPRAGARFAVSAAMRLRPTREKRNGGRRQFSSLPFSAWI